VRGVGRRAQVALRLALGATRTHIIRHTMAEGVLMALLGGALGILVSIAATDGILLLAFQHSRYVPIYSSPSLPVLLFALALSLLTGIFFSAVPAWIASRAEPAQPMRSVARSTFDRSELPQRSMLVLQAAVSLVLLVSAGLLSTSLHHLQS